MGKELLSTMMNERQHLLLNNLTFLFAILQIIANLYIQKEV